MAKRRSAPIQLALLLSCTFSTCDAKAQDDWHTVNEQVRKQVFRLNVGMKVRVGGYQYAQLADLSPRKHYPVFATSPRDQGYRIVGSGTCFPIETVRRDTHFLVTNRHVTDYGDGLILECERFFAALRLQAERTAAFADPEVRYLELARVVNLSQKKGLSGAERRMYQATVDTIWDTYDSQLSTKVDPDRQKFSKYLALAKLQSSCVFFVHASGSSSKAAMMAQLYRNGSSAENDLAILTCKQMSIKPLHTELTAPQIGEVVEAVGYPAVKQSGVMVPSVYEPTFTVGRVKDIGSDFVEFQAPVSHGDSGGPLINRLGQVLGVVAKRTKSRQVTSSVDRLEIASAISVTALMQFAPELFIRTGPKPKR